MTGRLTPSLTPSVCPIQSFSTEPSPSACAVNVHPEALDLKAFLCV
jgi:hypothetical protein